MTKPASSFRVRDDDGRAVDLRALVDTLAGEYARMDDDELLDRLKSASDGDVWLDANDIPVAAS